jgi:MoaA/NifB/PqqE/SkfB family radical SAM enzyme
MIMDRMKILPRPFPDTDFYKSNLEAGFDHFPKRRENYLKYQASKRGEVLDYLPIKLDIENISRCNYHCTMCQVSDWPGLQRAGDMSLEDFKELIDSQYGLIEIKLQGLGEPFMGRSYIEMIQYARAKLIWVRSTTNASLLHIHDNYKRVIDADICELQVSIDGTTAETYEKIRRGGRFDKVRENCVLLNKYCSEAGRKRSRMWVVLQRDNFEELERFPALASELGFERLSISLDVGDFGQERWHLINDPVQVHAKFDQSLAEHLIALGKEHNVAVTFWFLNEKFDTTVPAKLCPWPFERVYVSSDMRIVPCCLISNPDTMELGDARSLTAEWNGSQMMEFRRSHLQGAIPKLCQACYMNSPKP